MQSGEQLNWGVLGESVSRYGAPPLACGDPVAVVRYVTDLGLGDSPGDIQCCGGQRVSVGFCARCAGALLCVTLQPPQANLPTASIEISHDAVQR